MARPCGILWVMDEREIEHLELRPLAGVWLVFAVSPLRLEPLLFGGPPLEVRDRWLFAGTVAAPFASAAAARAHLAALGVDRLWTVVEVPPRAAD